MRQEHELRARGPPDLNLVAVRQPLFGHLRAVDVRSAARCAVANEVLAVIAQDFGVLARDVVARQPKVVRPPASDRERRLVEHHDPAALRIGDFDPRVCHGYWFCVSNPRLAAR